ncbi:MAG: hypothetical protein K6G80_02580 [Treponema sp.]|nr:hypothetical protein [Treponema sp.]
MEKVIFAGVIDAIPRPQLSEERDMYCELVVSGSHGKALVQVTSVVQWLLYQHAQIGDVVLVCGTKKDGVVKNAHVFRRKASFRLR